MNSSRNGTFNGSVIGAALAAIAFGALIVVLTSKIGHLPHDARRILFISLRGFLSASLAALSGRALAL
jgi:hypothetical protein